MNITNFYISNIRNHREIERSDAYSSQLDGDGGGIQCR